MSTKAEENYLKAIECCDEMILLDENDVQAWCAKGGILNKIGKSELELKKKSFICKIVIKKTILLPKLVLNFHCLNKLFQ